MQGVQSGGLGHQGFTAAAMHQLWVNEEQDIHIRPVLMLSCVVLNGFISKADEPGFNEFKTRVYNQGNLPNRMPTQSSYGSTTTSMTQQGMRPPQSQTGAHCEY